MCKSLLFSKGEHREESTGKLLKLAYFYPEMVESLCKIGIKTQKREETVK